MPSKSQKTKALTKAPMPLKSAASRLFDQPGPIDKSHHFWYISPDATLPRKQSPKEVLQPPPWPFGQLSFGHSKKKHWKRKMNFLWNLDEIFLHWWLLFIVNSHFDRACGAGALVESTGIITVGAVTFKTMLSLPGLLGWQASENTKLTLGWSNFIFGILAFNHHQRCINSTILVLEMCDDDSKITNQNFKQASQSKQKIPAYQRLWRRLLHCYQVGGPR